MFFTQERQQLLELLAITNKMHAAQLAHFEWSADMWQILQVVHVPSEKKYRPNLTQTTHSHQHMQMIAKQFCLTPWAKVSRAYARLHLYLRSLAPEDSRINQLKTEYHKISFEIQNAKGLKITGSVRTLDEMKQSSKFLDQVVEYDFRIHTLINQSRNFFTTCLTKLREKYEKEIEVHKTAVLIDDQVIANLNMEKRVAPTSLENCKSYIQTTQYMRLYMECFDIAAFTEFIQEQFKNWLTFIQELQINGFGTSAAYTFNLKAETAYAIKVFATKNSSNVKNISLNNQGLNTCTLEYLQITYKFFENLLASMPELSLNRFLLPEQNIRHIIQHVSTALGIDNINLITSSAYEYALSVFIPSITITEEEPDLSIEVHRMKKRKNCRSCGRLTRDKYCKDCKKHVDILRRVNKKIANDLKAYINPICPYCDDYDKNGTQHVYYDRHSKRQFCDEECYRQYIIKKNRYAYHTPAALASQIKSPENTRLKRLPLCSQCHENPAPFKWSHALKNFVCYPCEHKHNLLVSIKAYPGVRTLRSASMSSTSSSTHSTGTADSGYDEPIKYGRVLTPDEAREVKAKLRKSEIQAQDCALYAISISHNISKVCTRVLCKLEFFKDPELQYTVKEIESALTPLCSDEFRTQTVDETLALLHLVDKKFADLYNICGRLRSNPTLDAICDRGETSTQKFIQEQGRELKKIAENVKQMDRTI